MGNPLVDMSIDWPEPHAESKPSRLRWPNVALSGARNLDPHAPNRHVKRMLIYKILTGDQWAAWQSAGTFTGAPIDLADGYIHTSTAQQAQETADKHFAGQDRLILAALEADSFGDDLKWEVSRGDALFPHIFRDISVKDVVWARPMPLVDGKHVLDFA